MLCRSQFTSITTSTSNSEYDYPNPAKGFINSLGFASLQPFAYIPAACIFPGSSFYDSLMIYTLGPIVLVFLFGIGFVFVAVVQMARKNSTGLKKAWMHFVNYSLLGLYLLLPSVSTKIFSTFICREIGEDDLFLEEELTLSCKQTAEGRRFFEFYAFAFIGVYPVGVPTLCFFVLYSFRHKISPRVAGKVDGVYNIRKALEIRKKNEDLEPIKFLFEFYTPPAWWFGIFQLAMRLLETSTLVFIDTEVQIVFAVVMQVVYLIVQRETNPYISPEDNVLGYVAAWTVFLWLFGLLLIQYDALGGSQQYVGFLLLSISCSIVFVAVPSVLDEVRFNLSTDRMSRSVRKRRKHRKKRVFTAKTKQDHDERIRARKAASSGGTRTHRIMSEIRRLSSASIATDISLASDASSVATDAASSTRLSSIELAGFGRELSSTESTPGGLGRKLSSTGPKLGTRAHPRLTKKISFGVDDIFGLDNTCDWADQESGALRGKTGGFFHSGVQPLASVSKRGRGESRVRTRQNPLLKTRGQSQDTSEHRAAASQRTLVEVLLFPGASIDGVTFYEKQEHVVIQKVSHTASLKRELLQGDAVVSLDGATIKGTRQLSRLLKASGLLRRLAPRTLLVSRRVRSRRRKRHLILGAPTSWGIGPNCFECKVTLPAGIRLHGVRLTERVGRVAIQTVLPTARLKNELRSGDVVVSLDGVSITGGLHQFDKLMLATDSPHRIQSRQLVISRALGRNRRSQIDGDDAGDSIEVALPVGAKIKGVSFGEGGGTVVVESVSRLGPLKDEMRAGDLVKALDGVPIHSKKQLTRLLVATNLQQRFQPRRLDLVRYEDDDDEDCEQTSGDEDNNDRSSSVVSESSLWDAYNASQRSSWLTPPPGAEIRPTVAAKTTHAPPSDTPLGRRGITDRFAKSDSAHSRVRQKQLRIKGSHHSGGGRGVAVNVKAARRSTRRSTRAVHEEEAVVVSDDGPKARNARYGFGVSIFDSSSSDESDVEEPPTPPALFSENTNDTASVLSYMNSSSSSSISSSSSASGSSRSSSEIDYDDSRVLRSTDSRSVLDGESHDRVPSFLDLGSVLEFELAGQLVEAEIVEVVPSQAQVVAYWEPTLCERGQVYCKITGMHAKLADDAALKASLGEGYEAGDYIVVGSTGNQYPMKALAFAARYMQSHPEAATDPALAAEGFRLFRPKGKIWALELSDEEVESFFPSGQFMGKW